MSADRLSIVYAAAESFEPATSGGRIRSLGIATALLAIGDVEVLALDEVGRMDEWGAACRRFAGRGRVLRHRLADRANGALKGNLRLLERMTAAGGVAAFEAILRRTATDTVVLSVPLFGGFVDGARRRGVRVIADAHESLVRANRSILASDAALPARLRALLDLQEARRFEPREYRAVDQLWVASHVERRHFLQVVPHADIRVVPNLAPGADLGNLPAGPVRSIGFVGSYGYAPNEEAALLLTRDVLPAIRTRVGPIELMLIGRDPTPAMKTLASETAGVTVTGLVADAVAFLRESGILVVPLRAGAGSRIKILEAMRAGVPVVTTAAGLEGLDAERGRDLLVADTPNALADAVAAVRDDEGLRNRLVASGRAFVREHHSQEAITRAVRDALSGAVAEG